MSDIKPHFITVLAFLALAFSIVSYFSYAHRASLELEAYYAEQADGESQNKITFSGPYCFPDRHPDLLLAIIGLSGLSFGAGVFLRHPAWPVLLAAGAFAVFPYWYFETQGTIAMATTAEVAGLDRFLYRAGTVDMFVLILLSIVFILRLYGLLSYALNSYRRPHGLQ